ncbi:ankyrin repeat and PRANC domain-containing protein [Cotia virus SPAn232]|uniref:Ankyrin repeat and PRANC domain-containing protein n=2 Tax=Cotia virus TaxID=39444 RepID=H6TAH2_9POXV|nr:ankyrin repeat and PRANC domain-containing protein [Cotia virus SPAn232]AFB76909.1 ankyrin repeat and PRANC domain-containing protein [Cotia virus SPAn232]AIT70634.1 ankyrin repeat and PRANC domain-containing protein [Cotia virus]
MTPITISVLEALNHNDYNELTKFSKYINNNDYIDGVYNYLDYYLSIKRQDHEVEYNIVKLLIDVGIKTNYVLNNGDTILHKYFNPYRIKISDKIVKIIVESGCDLSAANINLNTPLHCYVNCCYNQITLETVKLLIKNGANPNVKNIFGYTPLQYYVKNLFIKNEITTMLLSPISDEEEEVFGSLLHLYLSRPKNGVECIKPLARSGINYKDSGGDTPIMTYLINCSKMDENIVKEIIYNGGDINTINNDNYTTLHYYLMYCNNVTISSIDLFISMGYSFPSSRGIISSYLKGYYKVELEIVKYLYYLSTNSKKILVEDCYFIHEYFKRADDVDVSDYLLNVFNYCVDITDDNGYTLLHYAVDKYGSEQVIRYLISKGANINTINKSGKTILYSAGISRPINIFKTLLEFNPSVNTILATIKKILQTNHINKDALKELIKYSLMKNITIDEELIKMYDLCNEFINDCISELDEMKKIRVSPTMSLFCILNKSENELYRYIKNPATFDVLKFNIYGQLLSSLLENARIRSEFIEKACDFVSSNNILSIPREIQIKVFSYLNNNDISLFVD